MVRLRECPRGLELTNALRMGCWPLAGDDALREHVEHCECCRETVLVARFLCADRAEAIRAMPMASPGLLWWRAQILQRQAAIRQASRPIHVAITVSLVTSLVVVMAVLVTWRSQLASWFLSAVVPVSAQTNSVSSPNLESWPLLFMLCAVAALAAIGGITIYAAVQRK